MVAINQNLCPVDRWAIKCPYGMNPTRIVVHNTANDAPAANEIAYMIRNDNYTSFHYAVDDVQALQGLLENRNGWHAGDGNGAGNREGIGIEICYSLNGGERFIKSEQNAVELIVDILKRYGWGIDKVTKHQDYSGKYCPHRTLDMGWDRFLNMIQVALTPPNPTKPVPAAIKYDKPKMFFMNFEGVNLWKLDTNPNYVSAKQFAKGEKFQAVGYIPFNGTKYIVSDYSFNKNIPNGVNINDVTEIIEPVITTKEEVVITAVPFDKKTIEDKTKPVGYLEITTKGVDGKRTITYTITLTDGKETSRVVKSDLTTTPVTEITTKGTYVKPVDPPVVPPVDPDQIPNWFIKFWEKVIAAILSALGKVNK